MATACVSAPASSGDRRALLSVTTGGTTLSVFPPTAEFRAISRLHSWRVQHLTLECLRLQPPSEPLSSPMPRRGLDSRAERECPYLEAFYCALRQAEPKRRPERKPLPPVLKLNERRIKAAGRNRYNHASSSMRRYGPFPRDRSGHPQSQSRFALCRAARHAPWRRFPWRIIKFDFCGRRLPSCAFRR